MDYMCLAGRSSRYNRDSSNKIIRIPNVIINVETSAVTCRLFLSLDFQMMYQIILEHTEQYNTETLTSFTIQNSK